MSRGRDVLAYLNSTEEPDPPGHVGTSSRRTVRGESSLQRFDEPTTSDAGIRSRLRVNPRKTERYITMYEALEHVSGHTRNVVVLPPDAGDRDIPTDEDGSDDDHASETEMEVAGEIEVENESSEEESSEPEEHLEDKPRWRKRALFDHEWETMVWPMSLDEEYPLLASKSEFEIWCEIFDERIIGLINRETLLYGRRDRCSPAFTLEEDELTKFLGIILFSGYHTVPSERDYWSNQPDLKVDFVAQSMTRNRFMEIKSFLHLADNHALRPGDKFAKVTPLYVLLDEALQRLGIFHEKLSIDESMVPYRGRHSARQYIHGKPIKFGYKIWTLAGSDGYPYKSILYGGQSSHGTGPLGSRVVLALLEPVKRLSHSLKHCVFFDNFFTSYQLLLDLKEKAFRATGTVRPTRTNGAAKTLASDKDLKEKGRGEFDYCCDGQVYFVKWNDSAVVHVGSNYLTHEPVQLIRRRIKLSMLHVPQPFIVKEYNHGMGGVDLLDKLLSSYRPTICGKKWWWPLFVHALNMSVVAAWRLYATLHPSQATTHLAFRRAVTLCLLKGNRIRRQIAGGRHAQMPADIRYDGIDHNIVPTTQGRCVMCSANTRSMCSKCEVRLHHSRGAVCYSVYHKSP